jgi:hypothetical protein
LKEKEERKRLSAARSLKKKNKSADTKDSRAATGNVVIKQRHMITNNVGKGVSDLSIDLNDHKATT